MNKYLDYKTMAGIAMGVILSLVGFIAASTFVTTNQVQAICDKTIDNKLNAYIETTNNLKTSMNELKMSVDKLNDKFYGLSVDVYKGK